MTFSHHAVCRCILLCLLLLLVPAGSAASEYYTTLPITGTVSTTNAQEYLLQNQPPLTISFSVTPQMVTDQKYIMPSSDSTAGYYKTITRPSQSSWCLVNVLDKESMELLAQDGYGDAGARGNFEQSNTVKEFTVYKDGPYIVSLSCQDATMDYTIKGGTVVPKQAKTTQPTVVSTTAPTNSADAGLAATTQGSSASSASTGVPGSTQNKGTQGSNLILGNSIGTLLISCVIGITIFGSVELGESHFRKKKK